MLLTKTVNPQNLREFPLLPPNTQKRQPKIQNPVNELTKNKMV